MTTWTPETIARDLLEAEASRTSRTPYTTGDGALTLQDAYAAQDHALQLRRDRGELVIGIKLGVTSRAKQRQVGVDSPNVAWLTDAMVLAPDAPVPIGDLIHPRAEPEIAFVLGRDLAGPGVTAASALAAVASVHGAVEIIDSRFSGYRFTAVDATADNASSGRFLVNPSGLPATQVDTWLEGCAVEVDGEVVDSATGAAVCGHPLAALAFAANTLASRGHALRAGWIVLTGGLTEAVPLQPVRTVSAHFTTLGSVTVRTRD